MKLYKLRSKLVGVQRDLTTTNTFKSNGWISPSGDFYGCEGAQHYQSACWICIFILKKTQDDLRKGGFFKHTFEALLREEGWVCIKDTSWCGLKNGETHKDCRTIFRVANTTEKQELTIQKYSDYFDEL